MYGLEQTATEAVPTPSSSSSGANTPSFSTASQNLLYPSYLKSSTLAITQGVASMTILTSEALPSTSPTSASSASPSSTQSSPFAKSSTAASYASKHVLGISIGSAIASGVIMLALLALGCWRKHRKNKQRQQVVYHQPRLPSREPSMAELRNLHQLMSPPRPDTNSRQLPSQQTLSLDGTSAPNRSQSNTAIIPDHDGEQNGQPDLHHAPPFDPYHIPQPPPAAFENQERYWASRPPSYRTHASITPQRRPLPRNQRPTIPDALSNSSFRSSG